MPNQTVRFLRRFCLKTGTDFAHFGLESGVVLEDTTRVNEPIYRFNSKWIRKKLKYANLMRILRNIFCWNLLAARSEKGCEKCFYLVWYKVRIGEPGGTPLPRVWKRELFDYGVKPPIHRLILQELGLLCQAPAFPPPPPFTQGKRTWKGTGTAIFSYPSDKGRSPAVKVFINPLSSDIHNQILQTDIHTFP